MHTNILLEWSNSARKLARVYFPNSICVKVCFCKVYPLPANASSNRCKFILTQRCVLLLCLSKKRTWLTQLFKAPPRDNGRRAESPTINTQHNFFVHVIKSIYSASLFDGSKWYINLGDRMLFDPGDQITIFNWFWTKF